MISIILYSLNRKITDSGNYQIAGKNYGFITVFLNKSIFYFDYIFTKPKYLAINCFEIEKFKKLYSIDAKDFISYNHEILNVKNIEERL